MKSNCSPFGLLCGCLVLTLPLLSGCKDAIENHSTDNAFIRMPDQLVTTVPMKEGSFFPSAPGSTWQMQVQQGSKVVQEQDVIVNPTPIGGRNGVTMEMRNGGKAYRREVYQVDANGISLMAAGGDSGQMEMSPPIPLVQLPIKIGESISWNGILHYKTTSAAGQALSRVSGSDRIKTPAGTFDVYRVDSIITTIVQGKPVAFPAVRWIAPGVGVVQQKMMAGRESLIKQLTGYHISGQP